MATNEAGNIGINAVTNMWVDLDGYYNFGNSLYYNTQCYYCYGNGSFGYSNYNALTMSVQKRTTHGLTVNANATYGHALGTVSLAQTYTFATQSDPWDYRVDYGPQYYDRRFTLNVLGTYQLPFGPGHKWGNNNGVVKRLVGGWAVYPSTLSAPACRWGYSATSTMPPTRSSGKVSTATVTRLLPW